MVGDIRLMVFIFSEGNISVKLKLVSVVFSNVSVGVVVFYSSSRLIDLVRKYIIVM